MTTNYTVTLQWRNNTGAAIRLFKAAETNGGTNYLFNQSEGLSQVDFASYPCYGYVSPIQTISLSQAFASTAVPTPSDYFIFCGTAYGSDELVLQITNQYGGVVGEASVFLNLKDIKQMYERWVLGNDYDYTQPIPNIAVPATNDLPSGTGSFQYSYDPSVDSKTPYILHVHGSNMELWEKDRYAETMYKRLYWQGYQGRFGSFRWPTSWGNTALYVATHPYAFDQIEFVSWLSAVGLSNTLANLNTLYPGQVELTAHSMGNIAAGEALRQAKETLVNVYAAFEGSGAAHCYDPNTPRVSLGIADVGEPDVYSHYWTATNAQYFADAIGAATYVDYYNTNDFVLNFWLDDQLVKPQTLLGYGYNYSLSEYYVDSSLLGFPADTYRIFAFCQQADCNCIGEQGNIGGQFTSLGIPQQVNLRLAPYNFGNQHKYHSGQFRSDNMSRAVFWNQLLIQMNLK